MYRHRKVNPPSRTQFLESCSVYFWTMWCIVYLGVLDHLNNQTNFCISIRSSQWVWYSTLNLLLWKTWVILLNERNEQMQLHRIMSCLRIRPFFPQVLHTGGVIRPLPRFTGTGPSNKVFDYIECLYCRFDEGSKHHASWTQFFV